MSRMASVKKQNLKTWTNLHSRLRSTPFDYGQMFPAEVRNYVKDNATAISSCEGYVVDSMLATTGFVIADSSTVMYNGMESKTNLLFLFVGPPSTGKSQAVKIAAKDPLDAISTARDSPQPLAIGKATSAGLLHRLAKDSGMLISTEVHDVLLKMIKNDGDTASGDIATLCHLFSGEAISTSYATQENRVIESGRAFSMLGATQTGPAAQVMTGLDVGNGFIERLIFHVPDCLRPSPQETRICRENIKDAPSISLVISIIENLHHGGVKYSFSDEGEKELDVINEAYIQSVNDAIRDGTCPPQSKKLDLVLRIAVPLHVLCSVIPQVLLGEPVTKPSPTISLASLNGALKYIEYVESQKETFLDEIREITSVASTPERPQPTPASVLEAIAKSPGPVVTFRSFKMSCSRCFRSVSRAEYRDKLDQLKEHHGEIVMLAVGGGQRSEVFVKAHPDRVDWELSTLAQDDYRSAFCKRQPKAITRSIQDALVEQGKCTQDLFL